MLSCVLRPLWKETSLVILLGDDEPGKPELRQLIDVYDVTSGSILGAIRLYRRRRFLPMALSMGLLRIIRVCCV